MQIKGYPVRLPLDVVLVFSANPEDYTARGKIVTPLKDRIGSEIKTHYPATLDHGVAITEQEAWIDRNSGRTVLSFRTSSNRLSRGSRSRRERINASTRRSGVSQRLADIVPGKCDQQRGAPRHRFRRRRKLCRVSPTSIRRYRRSPERSNWNTKAS